MECLEVGVYHPMYLNAPVSFLGPYRGLVEWMNGMAVLSWTKIEWKAHDKSCEDCALKRGWTKKYLAAMPYPFFCVHKTGEAGEQRICAGDKKKAERFAKEQFGRK